MRFSFGNHDADVEMVNRNHAVAVLHTGEEIAVTNWFDDDGDECSPHAAVMAVAGPDKLGRWYTIDLSVFEPTILN